MDPLTATEPIDVTSSGKVKFAMIPNVYARDATVSVTARLVWIILDSHERRDTKECYPSMDTLADEVGASVSTVQRAIKELVRVGWLTVTSRRAARRPNIYDLVWPAVVIEPTPEALPLDGCDRSPMTDRADPRSVTHDLCDRSPMTDEQEPVTRTKTQTRASRRPRPEPNLEWFEAFWQVYPHRHDSPRWRRKDALTAWAKVPAERRRATIEAAKVYAASRDVARGFVMRPDRWLDTEPWTSTPARPGQVDDGWVVLDVPDFSRPAAQA